MKATTRVYIQPAFLMCVATLVTAAAVMSFAIEGFTAFFAKTPLPLKKSLDLLDENRLAPYKVALKSSIENEDVLKGLGTEDYIQWVLEDSDLSESDPARKCVLFITYYKLPDRVPHVPEECYAGGGYQRLATDSVKFRIDAAGINRELDGKYLVFGAKDSHSWYKSTQFPVLYLFNVSGEYAASRDEARMALNKGLFAKSMYFCKIEMIFKFGAVTKQQAVAECERLLGVVLPLLEEEHWPDLEG